VLAPKTPCRQLHPKQIGSHHTMGEKAASANSVIIFWVMLTREMEY
jgi:hypothetical protein